MNKLNCMIISNSSKPTGYSKDITNYGGLKWQHMQDLQENKRNNKQNYRGYYSNSKKLTPNTVWIVVYA